MPLDWDIKLDSVSIKDEITSFTLTESKGSYVKELTIFSVSPDFYSQFTYGDLPTARLELLTKVESSWVSQGLFFIEKPVFAVDPNSITSPGVWGRSETAILGTPFAKKITKTWDTTTSCCIIIDEMAALGGITVIKEMADYPIVAGTFVVEGKDPISVIQELVDYSNGYLGCSSAGELLIKEEKYHLSTSVHTLTDIDIAKLGESIEYPVFGNRILVGAMGEGGYSVDLYSLTVNCLPNDGTSKATLLAFVTDSKGEVAADGTIVSWQVSSPGAVLDDSLSNVGTYFLENWQYKSNSYHTIDVDYPVYDVIGIWAYADYDKSHNYWNPDTDFFIDNTISLSEALPYCDQTLIISYIIHGVAANTVTSGLTDIDIVVTTDVKGESDSLTIKQGAGCDCGAGILDAGPGDGIPGGPSGPGGSENFGTGLNIAVNPSSGVCFENSAAILIWATLNGAAAVGRTVNLAIFSGCGTLSSTSKVLGTETILNEVGTINNNISNVSRCTTNIIIDNSTTPTVYQFTEDDQNVKTRIGNNLYAAFGGNTIDLNTVLPTGTNVLINYTARGAALSSWRTDGITASCDVVISASMADGSEAGLHVTGSSATIDCSIPDSSIPDTPPGDSADDPSNWDGGSGGGGFEDEDEDEEDGAILTTCDIAILNRIGGKEAAVTDEDSTINRFQSDECPENEEDQCSCSDLCESEMYETGSTYDNPGETIAQTVENAGNVPGTPEYNEAYETEKQSQLSDCSSNCEGAREEACGDCIPTTSPTELVLSPGSSMEITCSDGTTELIEMPEGACGVQTFKVGCCEFEVRSTTGQWNLTSSCNNTTVNCPGYSICSWADAIGPGAGTKTQGVVAYLYTSYPTCETIGTPCSLGECANTEHPEGAPEGALVGLQDFVFTWECP